MNIDGAGSMRENAGNAASIASEMFEAVARSFPVCSSSDEFYYFPQVNLPEPYLSKWDDFSPESIEDITGKLFRWEKELTKLHEDSNDQDDIADIRSLKAAALTLREQLEDVRFHQNQPTFYLTIANIGLAEALCSLDEKVWRGRVDNLPAFLEQAGRNLKAVPALFMDLGQEMVSQSRNWVRSLMASKPDLEPVMQALQRFGDLLLKIPTCDDFLPKGDLMERIIRDHLGCRTSIDECIRELDLEIEEMEAILKEEAGKLFPGGSWLEVLERMPEEILPEGGAIELYQIEVDQLQDHCLNIGLVSPDLARSCPVMVVPVPPYLSAVRTADAYSARAGYPPSGGTFFVLDESAGRSSKRGLPLEYKMTTAHETYPGHHLLDINRWSLQRAVRRPIESPLFYEGWACFAEDILARTGYFSGRWDRLILARRRFKRAVRGKMDLEMQSGRIDMKGAAKYLSRAGFRPDQSMSAVRRYALRPGYQVCYTSGQRRFMLFFERYGRGDIKRFARTVLAQGEIGFDDLERVFSAGAGRQSETSP